MAYFIKKAGSDPVSFQDTIEDFSILDEFREKFWQSVVNFSSPSKRELLKEMWTALKKELSQVEVKLKIESESGTNSTSESNPEVSLENSL